MRIHTLSVCPAVDHREAAAADCRFANLMFRSASSFLGCSDTSSIAKIEFNNNTGSGTCNEKSQGIQIHIVDFGGNLMGAGLLGLRGMSLFQTFVARGNGKHASFIERHFGYYSSTMKQITAPGSLRDNLFPLGTTSAIKWLKE